jgi:poly(ADP-ribose) glycohydrolase ARH3
MAISYAQAWQTAPFRGYPPTAKAVMAAILGGADYRSTGYPPHFPFEDGSFANGGAMRISPLAVAFRNATPQQLYEACKEAIRSSHRHPEAVDGAAVQAAVVQYALHSRAAAAAMVMARSAGEGNHSNGELPNEFSAETMLSIAKAACKTKAMQQRIEGVSEAFKTHGEGNAHGEQFGAMPRVGAEFAFASAVALAAGAPLPRSFLTDLQVMCDLLKCDKDLARQGSGFEFQVAAIDATACVLWVVARYHRPLLGPAGCQCPIALSRAIGLGGDTDTVASMVGAILGALHGTAWIPQHLSDGLEDDHGRGKSHALNLAAELVELDLSAG